MTVHTLSTAEQDPKSQKSPFDSRGRRLGNGRDPFDCWGQRLRDGAPLGPTQSQKGSGHGGIHVIDQDGTRRKVDHKGFLREPVDYLTMDDIAAEQLGRSLPNRIGIWVEGGNDWSLSQCGPKWELITCSNGSFRYNGRKSQAVQLSEDQMQRSGLDNECECRICTHRKYEL